MTTPTIYTNAFVYIAGPFRGPNSYIVRMNVRNAEALSLLLYRHGIPHFCPHTQSANFDGAADDYFFLEIDKAIIRDRCTHILTVPGWQNSVGSRAEVDLGKQLDISVYHDPIPLITDIQEEYHEWSERIEELKRLAVETDSGPAGEALLRTQNEAAPRVDETVIQPPSRAPLRRN